MSHLPLGLQEFIQEPLPRPEKVQQDTKVNPLNKCLSCENKKDGKPLPAKSRINFLGDFKYHLYQKSQRYAPFLKYSSLSLLIAKSVGDKQILQQGGF